MERKSILPRDEDGAPRRFRGHGEAPARPRGGHAVVRRDGGARVRVTEELLVGVRNAPETPRHTLALFAGLVPVFVIEMLVH